MRTFKTGNRIRRINHPTENMPIGKVVAVSFINEEDGSMFLQGFGTVYNHEDFELVTEYDEKATYLRI